MNFGCLCGRKASESISVLVLNIVIIVCQSGKFLEVSKKLFLSRANSVIIKGISINSSLLGFVQKTASQGNGDDAYWTYVRSY